MAAPRSGNCLNRLDSKHAFPPKAIESSPAKYHRGFYSKRHYVENLFQRIKEPLAIATRYEKLAARLLDLVKRTANCDWFKK